MDRARRYIDLDPIAIPDQADQAAFGCLWRDMAD
jgi:hypothetical protein